MTAPTILVTVELSEGTGGAVRQGRDAFLSDRVPLPVTRLEEALCPLLQDLHLGAWPQRSSAGLAIWLDAVEGAARRSAAVAVIEERTLLVDGTPMAVASVACGAHWSAAGRRDDLLLLLTAREGKLERVEIVSAADPLATFRDQ